MDCHSNISIRAFKMRATSSLNIAQYRQDIPIPNHSELLAISFVCKAKQVTAVFTP